MFQGKSMLAGYGAELPHKRHLMRSLIISMTCGQISLKCPSNARNIFYTSPPSCFDCEAQRAQKAVVPPASPVLALYNYSIVVETWRINVQTATNSNRSCRTVSNNFGLQTCSYTEFGCTGQVRQLPDNFELSMLVRVQSLVALTRSTTKSRTTLGSMPVGP